MPATLDGAAAPLAVLLVEDDDADALLVAEHLADAEVAGGFRVTLHRARSLAEADRHLDRVECVLLDLALPDGEGLDALARVLRDHGGPAVVVLTGRHDHELGTRAVAAGAQDYLLKHHVDGPSLERSLRYAVERVRGERVRQQLWDAQTRAEENVRLERGLLPTPLVADPDVEIAVRYEPGGGRRLLGGDFYDAVEGSDGTLHVVIGDVCGHGPDEAALGVNLRIAWRTVVLAETSGTQMLPTLGRLLVHERARTGIFATLAVLTVDPDRRRGRLRLAGHPPPVLMQLDGGVRPLPVSRLGRPIGIVADDRWEDLEIELPPRWGLLLYTDGLVEGRPVPSAVAEGEDVLGTDGLLAVVERCLAEETDEGFEAERMLERVMTGVRALTVERIDDVAAVLVVSRR
ncbi:fused response regulator/phosphatase [Actinomycetospora sp. NBRC 106378]|uniref:PP2C family protein-serine/threonine phosphatase n=1 Tax=Actinomycetospora sp. NBRC 106378 TaxID=3032208 RepID=UPI0024A5463C|nr:fused response regulator/phosphatase [Actinomycetospora sp. NBRC 106378]GLZ55642.1 serine/threonine phosphatase [Actinomycetospora sp. NBRC 106378]